MNTIHHAQKINQILYEISNTINTVSSFDEMLDHIHFALSNIIDVTNFFIALYNQKEDTLDFVFEKDSTIQYSLSPLLKKVSKTPSLSYKVIKSGKPLLIHEAEMINFARQMNKPLIGPSSKVWLGVPLKTPLKTIGVMAVQNYIDPEKFTKYDIDILQIVSDQIALVIEKKKAEDALIENEKRYRKLIENIDDVIFSIHKTGDFSYISPSIKRLTGYSQADILARFRLSLCEKKSSRPKSSEQEKKKYFEDIIHLDDKRRVIECIDLALSKKTPYDIEYRIKKKNKKVVWIRESGQITSNNSSGLEIDGILHNINERKHAEQVNKALYNITNSVNMTTNLNELFSSIHYSLSKVLDVTNFFIALYQEEKDTLEFPYAVDLKDDYKTIPIQKDLRKTNSLSNQVVQSGKPVLVRGKAMKTRLNEIKDIKSTGTPSKCWLGVPLIVKRKVIGVIAIQNYYDYYKYTDNDVDILMSVSDQIALAIDRKKTDQALTKSETRLRHLVENIDDTIFSISLDGKFDYISPVVKQFIGYDPNAIIGQNYFHKSELISKKVSQIDKADTNNFEEYIHLVHPDHQGKVLSRIYQAIESKSDYNVTYKLLCKKEYKWVYERGQYIVDPEKGPRIDGVLFDAHDKIHTNLINKTLYQITNAVNTTFNLNELFISIHKSLGTILDVSNFYIALLNEKEKTIRFPYNVDIHTSGPDHAIADFPLNQSEGFSITEYIINIQRPLLIKHSEYHELLTTTGKKSMGTPPKVYMGIPLLVKNKAIGVMATQSYDNEEYFNDDDLKLFTAVSNQVAIAIERKMAEEALKEETIKANAANKAKSDFLANMSHEIRTPMNAVMGMTALLRDTQLSAKQREYGDIINNSSTELLRIINDILDFTKVEAGKLDIEKIDFDLKLAMENIQQAMQSRIKDKRLDFECNIEPGIPLNIKGDPGRLRQVLNNLVGNAIKFTDKGKIELKVIKQSETDNQVTLQFSVSDTGIGIKPEDQDKLFVSFSQVDTSSTRKYGGTGLGLAISKKLVDLMKGKIHFKSQEDLGSQFFVTIPFEKSESEKILKNVQIKEIKDKQVLLIDPEPISQKQILTHLESFECKTVFCETLDDAIVHLKKFQVDFIIINDAKEFNDAYTCGETIIAQNLLGDALLIMIASKAIRGDAGKAQQAGFSTFLSTPFTKMQLYYCLVYAHGWKPSTKKENQPADILTRHKIKEIKQNNIKILLVEDNIVNQKVALLFLKKLNYLVDVAENGKVAVQMLEKTRYDLIFMDIQMPIMDGYEATRIIRDNTSKVLWHSIPIVALTAHAMKHDKNSCLNAGMDDYITKPVKAPMLDEAIKCNLNL